VTWRVDEHDDPETWASVVAHITFRRSIEVVVVTATVGEPE
jgi:hypothetical protein